MLQLAPHLYFLTLIFLTGRVSVRFLLLDYCLKAIGSHQESLPKKSYLPFARLMTSPISLA